MINFLNIKDLWLSYNKKNFVLKNINLSINKPELIAIVGTSGVGKTTLLQSILSGIQPSQGTIEIFDKNIYSIDKKEKSKVFKKVGFLSQKPNLILEENVFNNVAKSVFDYKNWFYKMFSILTKKQKEKIFTILNDLGILEKSFIQIKNLSGGEQQRVEIAKLLIQNVNLILADELFSNLDYNNSLKIMHILKNIKKNNEKSIIINLHNLDLLEHFDRCIVISKQEIILDKSIKDITKWEIQKILKMD